MTHTTIQRLCQAGIIAQLPENMSLQTITSTVDALLASPILAVQLVWQHESTADFVHDWQARASHHMVIGVVVSTQQAAQAAMAAGAQFIVASPPNPMSQEGCPSALWIPWVQTVSEARATLQVGSGICQLGGAVAAVKEVKTAVGSMPVLVNIKCELGEITQLRRDGADAIVVEEALFTGGDQPMADLIRRARAWNRAWSAALL